MMKSPFKFWTVIRKTTVNILWSRQGDRNSTSGFRKQAAACLWFQVPVSRLSSIAALQINSRRRLLPLVIPEVTIFRKFRQRHQLAFTNIGNQITTSAHFRKAVRSLYLDHYKPVFFIFDQFENFLFLEIKKRELNLYKLSSHL